VKVVKKKKANDRGERKRLLCFRKREGEEKKKKELRSEARSNENCQLFGQIDWSVYFY
jgi:hypothetical protein